MQHQEGRRNTKTKTREQCHQKRWISLAEKPKKKKRNRRDKKSYAEKKNASGLGVMSNLQRIVKIILKRYALTWI